MSQLTICPADRPDRAVTYRHPDEIAEKLWTVGVLFEQWETERPLAANAGQDEVIAAYQTSVNRLIDRYEFQSVDVISLQPDHPQKSELRAKFLNEHTHGEYEVRFFVEGRGLFYLHLDDQVYMTLCERGDLLSVPAGVKHWFDMGEQPDFRCIRLFTHPDGWVAEFTGDPIAERFPTLEQFLEQLA